MAWMREALEQTASTGDPAPLEEAPTSADSPSFEADPAILQVADPGAAGAPSLPPLGLAALRAVAYDAEAREVTLHAGGQPFFASLDPSVSAVVVRGAIARGERLIVEREGARFVVVGALRTAPIPGLDEGEEYVLRARRITVEGADEVTVKSGAASLVLRARGYIESLAQDITSRASSVHKIIGRMIHLN